MATGRPGPPLPKLSAGVSKENDLAPKGGFATNSCFAIVPRPLLSEDKTPHRDRDDHQRLSTARIPILQHEGPPLVYILQQHRQSCRPGLHYLRNDYFVFRVLHPNRDCHILHCSIHRLRRRLSTHLDRGVCGDAGRYEIRRTDRNYENIKIIRNPSPASILYIYICLTM